ncbi:MAG TPA: membrane protein insertase YidC [Acidimicrobiia bacterium]|jgi:YidC/Oxa1 family membrane protein insertase|nr:membrane protein insertase YidC [Acidimicrobiia bacterium]
MFDPLYDAFGAALAFFYALVPNEGVAIILLTIAVMLVLFPLTAKSARSMLAMQRLQPEIKKLQAKHKGDRQKLNEEMMKLYQEHKVNPLGGCLPLLVQLPVFFALFHVLRSPLSSVPKGSALYGALVAAKPGGLTFLSMDLSKKALDSHGSFASALPYFILVGLVVFTGYLQSKQTQRNTPPGADNRMLIIGKVLPIVFGVFSLNFPSGLVLYFFISNLWRVGQQELIMRKIAPRDHLRRGGAIDVKSKTSEKSTEPEPADKPTEQKPTEQKPTEQKPAARAPAKRTPRAPEARQSPLGALRGLFQPPPPKEETDGPARTEAPAPKPAASQQPAGSRSGSSRAGQSRRRRRRSSNKKRKR